MKNYEATQLEVGNYDLASFVGRPSLQGVSEDGTRVPIGVFTNKGLGNSLTFSALLLAALSMFTS